MRRLLAALLLWLWAAAPAQALMVLNRGNTAEPESLDPQMVGGTWEANIVGDLMVGLTTLDAAARPIPGMAERWETSPDGKTWTFHLRSAAWSDGVPATAQDFVFAWQRILDPATHSHTAANLWLVEGARAISAGKAMPATLGVEAKDRHTLVVHLTHPAPYLPELLTHQSTCPVPRHVVTAKGAAWSRPGSYVGNGPYSLKEWIPNDHVTLVKNPRFYDAGHVRIDVVNYIPTPDAEAALRRLRAGELDMQTPVPSTQLDWMRANMPGVLHVIPSLAIGYAAFNLSDPALKDVRVRKAINLIYNREAIVRQVLKLGEAPAYSYVPPGTANYPGGNRMDFASLPYGARIAEAQRLMRAAGYGPGNRLHLTYQTTTNPDAKRLAAIFQAVSRMIYVDMSIETSDRSTLLRDLRLHQFQIGGSSWLADFNDASNFLDLLRSDSGSNYAGYRNPRFDAAMDAAEKEPDVKKRGMLLQQAEKIALADYPWMVTRFLSQTEAVRPQVKGYVQNIRDFNRTRWLWLAH